MSLDFKIGEFYFGDVYSPEEYSKIKSDVKVKYNFFNINGFFILFPKKKDFFLVQDIMLSYLNKYNDGALLVFVNKNEKTYTYSFIDTSVPFSKNAYLIQEINISEYKNDYKKLEDALYLFDAFTEKKVKIFYNNCNKSELEDFETNIEIMSVLEKNKFFPIPRLSKKTKISFVFTSFIKSAFAVVLILFIGINIVNKFNNTKEEVKQKNYNNLAELRKSKNNLLKKLNNIIAIDNKKVLK